jgi:hypothetical protein
LACYDTNRRARLVTDYVYLSERLGPLDVVIETLRSAQRLRPDAAARLAHDEKHEARLAWERQKVEHEIDDLVLEESQRQMCEFSPAAVTVRMFGH